MQVTKSVHVGNQKKIDCHPRSLECLQHSTEVHHRELVLRISPENKLAGSEYH